MSPHLLFLTHRIPFPPNKGDKIRSYHLLQHLRQNYTVHVGSFIDDQADWQYESEIKALSDEYCLRPLPSRVGKLRSLSGFLSGEALSLPYYRDTVLQTWVNATIAKHDIHNMVVFSSAMAQYIEPFTQARRVMDFVDIDSDKWLQYALTKKWPYNWVYRREGKRLLDYERHVARQFTASFFVSPHEAELFQQLAPESADKIHYFNNGVDAVYFSPDHPYPNPYSPDEQGVVFTGAMDYWPNVDAVVWFARDIFPLIRQQHPCARFYIVGSNPTLPVQQLAQQSGVVVTGKVDDVRPWLAHARLAVVPLRIARGVQNKVLEAVAMAKTVVATPQAIAGVTGAIRAHCAIDEQPAGFAARVIAQLNNPPSPNFAGRQAILEQYNWQRNLARIDAYLTGGSQ